jgi:hypothetical protein
MSDKKNFVRRIQCHQTPRKIIIFQASFTAIQARKLNVHIQINLLSWIIVSDLRLMSRIIYRLVWRFRVKLSLKLVTNWQSIGTEAHESSAPGQAVIHEWIRQNFWKLSVGWQQFAAIDREWFRWLIIDVSIVMPFRSLSSEWSTCIVQLDASLWGIENDPVCFHSLPNKMQRVQDIGNWVTSLTGCIPIPDKVSIMLLTSHDIFSVTMP